MDWDYLLDQIKSRYHPLSHIHDEIGLSQSDRTRRDQTLTTVIITAIEGYNQQTGIERDRILQECRDCLALCMEMRKAMGEKITEDPLNVEFSKPLLQTRDKLRNEHSKVQDAYKERLVTIHELHQSLAAFLPHIEPSFFQVALPTGQTEIVNVTPNDVEVLTTELRRLGEEYSKRLATVQRLANEIVNLWAALGSDSCGSSISSSNSPMSVSQSEFDRVILENHQTHPERIGLKQETIQQLLEYRGQLVHEKQKRQRRIDELRKAIEAMWDKLGVENKERESFLRKNRGYSEKVVRQFNAEHERLNILKKQNMHLFIDAARKRLQSCWDELFFSEEQMLDFAPAFTDVQTDAALAAHEGEIARLQELINQRQSLISLVKRHISLVSEQTELEQSMKDPTRLTQRGAQAAQRLLREDKQRKRLAKELPKVITDLRMALEAYCDEYHEDFLVYGNSYLEELDRQKESEEDKKRSNAFQRRRLDAAPPTTPIKLKSNIQRSTTRPPPSRQGVRTLPFNRLESVSFISQDSLTNPPTPGRHRKPLQIMSTQAASIRSVAESPSPTKPIILREANLKVRPGLDGEKSSGLPVPHGHIPKGPQIARGGPFSVLPPTILSMSPPKSITSSISSGSSYRKETLPIFQATLNKEHRRAPSHGSVDRDSVISKESENWETYDEGSDEGSDEEVDYDTPKAGRLEDRISTEVASVSYDHQIIGMDDDGKRDDILASKLSNNTMVFVQHTNQKGEPLIGKWAKEAEGINDEWGAEGF